MRKKTRTQKGTAQYLVSLQSTLLSKVQGGAGPVIEPNNEAQGPTDHDEIGPHVIHIG